MESRPKRSKGIVIFLVVVGLAPLLFLSGCATVSTPPAPSVETQAALPQGVQPTVPSAPVLAPLPPLAVLKPRVAAEEKMPFEGKLFSLSTRSAPLQDVLLGLAKEASLNLVLEKGVDPNEMVSVEVKDLPLKKALNMVLASYAYFYEIDGNVLSIKAMETRLFRFDYPLTSNKPETDIGGDVLGGGGGGGGGGGSTSSNLSGEFSIEANVDEEYLNVWEQIEKALKPAEGGEGGLLSEQGRAQVNRMGGTIIVTDRRENILLVERLLNELEGSLKRQVVIEAKIVEVTLNQGHQYGIDWSYLNQNSGGFKDGIDISTNLGTKSGAFNLGWYPGGIDGFRAMLDLLATQGNTNVLSSPRINVLNNQTALISVGRAIPYLEWELRTVGTATATGATVYEPVPTVSRVQAGVTLGVTPQINADGITTLHIVPIVTDLVEYQTFTFEDNTWEVPVIDIRETDTMVRVPNGTTVVIGGLIQDKSRDNVTKIPFLGDVPGLGKLFSNQIRDNRKVELVILLTPTVVER